LPVEEGDALGLDDALVIARGEDVGPRAGVVFVRAVEPQAPAIGGDLVVRAGEALRLL